MSYMIVSESEANLKEGKLSVTTPIAKGLLGKKVGEKTTVTVPSGIMEFVNSGDFFVNPELLCDFKNFRLRQR